MIGSGSYVSSWCVARLFVDWVLDTSFGIDGIIEFESPGNILSLHTPNILEDGGFIVALNRNFNQTALLRFHPDGAAYMPFGSDGDGRVRPLSRQGAAFLQSNGIIVTGRDPRNAYRGLLERYDLEGRHDDGFGDDGVVTLPFEISGTIVLPDDRLLILEGALSGYKLVQLLPGGQLDPSFGEGNGYTELFTFRSGYFREIALQPDGRILIIASARDDSDDVVVLARHLPTGEIDPSFGEGGYAVYDLTPWESEIASALAFEPDGRILVGGHAIEQGQPYLKPFVLRVLGDAPAAISAAPEELPVVIPPEGGSFSFSFRLANVTEEPQTLSVWAEAEGLERHPLLYGPESFTLAPREVRFETVTQQVPARLAAGEYVYTVHAGAYPDGSITRASFTVTKEAGGAVSREYGRLAGTADGKEVAPPAASDETAAGVSELPEVFSLSAPVPHPVQNLAHLTLSIPTAQVVRVAVYDALGREVAVLQDGTLEAGTHGLQIDGYRLPAGVYIIRAEGGATVAVQRVTLLR